MADESHVIRGINWRETFPFTQIFRAFRVAIHPTKLILALAALLCIYLGGRVLDALWPVEHRAVPAFITRDIDPTTPSAVAAILNRRANAGGAAAAGGSRGEVYEYERFNAGVSQYESFKELRNDRR